MLRKNRRRRIARAYVVRKFALRERYYRLWFTCSYHSRRYRRRDRLACPFWAFPRCRAISNLTMPGLISRRLQRQESSAWLKR